MRTGPRWVAALVGAAVVVGGAERAQAEIPDHPPSEVPPPAPAAPVEPVAPAEPDVDRVVVVGVAGLRWDDVDPGATPHLARAARAGSTGSLSVRSAPEVTCPAEGWLTLGAGGYAAVRDPAHVDARRGCPGRPVPVPRSIGHGIAAVVPSVAELNERLRFDAQPGWLADQVSCIAAIGPGAGTAAADGAGRIARYLPTWPETPDALGGPGDGCPVMIVDAGTLPETAGRPAALRRVDELVGAVRAGRSERTVVMVLGVAETTSDRGRLHVAVVEGPGFGPGWLTSASTRRAPFVQLADVAPTVTSLLGGPAPDEVAGRPMSGQRPGRPTGPAAARSVLVDTDAQAVSHRAVVAPFFTGLGLAVLLVAGVLVTLLRRSGPGGEPPAWAVAALRSTALVLAAAPAATFLANLLPWWRSSVPLLAVAGATVIGALAVGALSSAVGRRAGASRRARARVEVAAVAVVSLAIVVVDVVSGAHLQLGSLLGYNPLVAGRFVGLGNIAFSVLGAAGVVVGAQAVRSRSSRSAAWRVAAVGAALVAVDGWPAWGADVGGVLTLVPAFVVLGTVVAGRHPRPAQVMAALAAGAGVAVAIGAIDFLRPADQRSHFGRFVGTALEGGALGVIERKAAASLDLLLMGPHTAAAAAAAVVLAVLVARPPALLRAAHAAHPCLRPMHLATLVLAGVGLLVNDSIIAVPMVVALVVGPLTLVLCASTAEDGGIGGPGDRSASRRWSGRRP